jgi:hypothetical protein
MRPGDTRGARCSNVDVKKRIDDNIKRICVVLMAHSFAHLLVRLPPLRGGMRCLGGFPGFHPGLRASAPPGHLFRGGTYIAQNAYGAAD